MSAITDQDYSSANFNRWMRVDKDMDFLPERYCPGIIDEIILSAPRMFSDRFSTMVGTISLVDTQILSPGRSAPPRNQADFGLTALVAQGAVHHDSDGTEKLVFGDLAASPPVRFEYNDYNAALDWYSEPDDPYIDGHIGVGLTYQDRLVALCFGMASTDGPLVTQIQDVSSKWNHDVVDPTTVDVETDGEEEPIKKGLPTGKYESGLHSGIDWKQTLLQTWHHVVPTFLHECGIYENIAPTHVQSAINNYWLRFVDSEFIERPLPENRQEFTALIYKKLAQFERVYDLSAIALGGVRDPQTNNYILPTVTSGIT